ncbi:MAG: phospholipase D-like domain-containing protein [Myxococcota bacterium]
MNAVAPVRFRRPLLLVEQGADAGAAAAWAAAIAPSAQRVHVLVHPHVPFAAGFVAEWWGTLGDRAKAGEAALERVRAALGGAVGEVRGEVLLALDDERTVAAIREASPDVVVMVAGSEPTRESTSWLTRVAPGLGLPVLRVDGSGPPEGGDRPPHVLCPFARDLAGLAPVAALLRRHAAPGLRATVLGLRAPTPLSSVDPAAIADVLELRGPLEVAWVEAGLLDAVEVLNREARSRGADVVCVPFGAAAGLPAMALAILAPGLLRRLDVPLLLAPGEPSDSGLIGATRLDAPDVVACGDGCARLRVDLINVLGMRWSDPDQRVVVVGHGRALTRVGLEEGTGRWTVAAADLEGFSALGLARESGTRPGRKDPVSALEVVVHVVRPGPEPVVLVDGGLAPDELRSLVAHVSAPDAPARIIAVRSSPDVACRDVRHRLMSAGLVEAPVLDAGLVLDDGWPDDVPGGALDLRLVRVARHLRVTGFRVEAVVGTGEQSLDPAGMAFLTRREARALPAGIVRERIESARRPPPDPSDPAGRLDELTSSRVLPGNRVRVEVDNTAARRALLEAVAGARETVHLQSYIVRDDPVSREIEDALRVAAARGVRVRVLVDALYSLHGAFGAHNPLLARLETTPNVEVRAFRRLEGFPSVADLKQRNHRKLLVVDGVRGMLTGRNLAQEYYRGFEEVSLGPASDLHEVPWVDAGAILEGPAVRALEAAFLDDWVASGGDAFPLPEAAEAGDVPVRVVLHRGMADTHTLDAYVALVRGARERITVVNTFPIQLAIQRALLQALERGVRVRLLFGNVRPLRGDGEPFPGSPGSLRDLATSVVHGRIDTLVAAGAEAWEVVVDPQPSWNRALGPVRPHVHAKVLSVDGAICTVGSANLDVTAGYWEHEALVVVDDPAVTADLDAALERLVATSRRVDPSDAAWQERAARRAWISRHWPSILG